MRLVSVACVGFVLVVYYDAETGVGLNPKSKLRDFGYQLTCRGFVSLSIGWPRSYTQQESPSRQPLSSLAYIAANCCNALANLPEVDPKRVGVAGHSFGVKWVCLIRPSRRGGQRQRQQQCSAVNRSHPLLPCCLVLPRFGNDA